MAFAVRAAAHAVHLDVASDDAIEVVIAKDLGIDGCGDMSTVGLRAACGAFIEEELTLRGVGHADARIPLGVVLEPSQGLGVEALHRDVGHHLVVLHVEHADPAIGEDNVGVKDLTGLGMDTAGGR